MLWPPVLGLRDLILSYIKVALCVIHAFLCVISSHLIWLVVFNTHNIIFVTDLSVAGCDTKMPVCVSHIVWQFTRGEDVPESWGIGGLVLHKFYLLSSHWHVCILGCEKYCIQYGVITLCFPWSVMYVCMCIIYTYSIVYILIFHCGNSFIIFKLHGFCIFL